MPLDASIVAGVVTLVGVLPTAVWLIKRRDLTLTPGLLFGLGFGNLSYALMAAAAGSTYGIEGLVRGVVFSSLPDLGSGALFWAIALRARKAAHETRR